MAEPQTRVAAKCKTICPHFVVPGVVASAEHYRDSWGSRSWAIGLIRPCLPSWRGMRLKFNLGI